MSLPNIPSSGLVWRGPVPKDQVTPSASPSGWHEPQLLQPSLDCLPRKLIGLKSRIGVPKRLLSGMPRAVKKAILPTRVACSTVPGAGGSLDGTSRVMTVFVSRFIAVKEKLASLLA